MATLRLQLLAAGHRLCIVALLAEHICSVPVPLSLVIAASSGEKGLDSGTTGTFDRGQKALMIGVINRCLFSPCDQNRTHVTGT